MLEVQRRPAAEPGGVADSVHPHRLARSHRRRPVRTMGVVVHRHRGEPHQPAVVGVLPLAASRSAAGSPRPAACSTPPRSWRRTIDRPHDARVRHHDAQRVPRLRRISDSFQIPYDHDPARRTRSRSRRDEFDLLCVELRALGVPLKADLDQAWRDFGGWRVNYDEVLVRLCALTVAPPGQVVERPSRTAGHPQVAVPSRRR